MKTTNQIADNHQIVSRFYNQILFRGDRVIKGAPKDRFQKETEWFKEAVKRIPTNIPHVYSYDKKLSLPDKRDLRYYEMQAIVGSNLYQWAITNKKDFTGIFRQLVELTKKLHRETLSPNSDDIFLMYYTKPKVALTEFINKSNIDTSVIVINDNKYSDPLKQLENIYKQLEERLLNTRYSFIHGDLTMSNTLIDNEGRLYLIDPRGCFGCTNFYGDVRYDITKIYYSIVGNFDSLNNHKFNYKREHDSINSHNYSIADNGLSCYKDKIIKEFGEQAEIIHFIHATIWLSLIPHLANNPEQQWCAFCHGVYLLNIINK